MVMSPLEERSKAMMKERLRRRDGGATDYSKGDRARAVDMEAYSKGYDKAFGKGCKQHPSYKVLRPPTADCYTCRRLWREKELGL